MSGQEAAQVFDLRRIMELLPHRYPFLLVDRVVELEPGKSVRAYKNVTFNEPFFQGHFPGLPVMPGVLILEALAQAGGIMTISSMSGEERVGKVFLFSGVDNARFRRPVYPGDQLYLHCTLTRFKLRIWKMGAKAYVEGQLAAEAELSAAMLNKGDL
ncbi:MAG: 3-hydroxyacyl-ACP dehydratase FabZ [Deltaproteobacteria bacterium]|jgi:3-hydroxyacyl-[acyl-carrier-protein] dehydratase|nr:3-hydroxyacyl-ACP dehydratase FabZ [Deltaproteobacteria bacterium]